LAEEAEGAIAESPVAETEGEPKSMLEAVQAALDAPTSKEEPPTSKPGKTEDSEDPKAEIDPTKKAKEEDDLSDADKARLSKVARARIEKVVRQRNEVEAEVKTLRPRAEQYDLIVKQIRETGLDQNDLNAVFNIGTLLKKGDVFGARAALEPIWAQVNRLTGGKVPDDLLQDVATGRLAEERARELAVARAAAEVNANRQQLAAREHEAKQAQALTSSLVDTVNAWEQTKARLDPDWKLKSPQIMQALKLSLLEGNRPKSPDEAVKMAEKALEEVNGRIRAFRPAPRAIRPAVGGMAASHRSNPAEPKSMREVIDAALGGG